MNQTTPAKITPAHTTQHPQPAVPASPAAAPQLALPVSACPPSARSRIGKIARLPLAVRDQLNQRLLDNEPAPALVSWLNSLPEVQAALAQLFASHPINDQNIYDWKQGGFAWNPNASPSSRLACGSTIASARGASSRRSRNRLRRLARVPFPRRQESRCSPNPRPPRSPPSLVPNQANPS